MPSILSIHSFWNHRPRQRSPAKSLPSPTSTSFSFIFQAVSGLNSFRIPLETERIQVACPSAAPRARWPSLGEPSPHHLHHKQCLRSTAGLAARLLSRRTHGLPLAESNELRAPCAPHPVALKPPLAKVSRARGSNASQYAFDPPMASKTNKT